jgi:hypothetical protein
MACTAWAIVAIAGLSWFGVYVWRSPHRDDLATYWSFVAAVAALVTGIPASLAVRELKAGASASRISD